MEASVDRAVRLSFAKYISKDDRWSTLSRDTRLVQDGAGNLEAVSDIAIGVRGTVKAIKQGLPMAELILVEPDGGMLVVVEGHTRATAYAVLSDRPFPAFVGTSPLMMQWSFI